MPSSESVIFAKIRSFARRRHRLTAERHAHLQPLVGSPNPAPGHHKRCRDGLRGRKVADGSSGQRPELFLQRRFWLKLKRRSRSQWPTMSRVRDRLAGSNDDRLEAIEGLLVEQLGRYLRHALSGTPGRPWGPIVEGSPVLKAGVAK